MKRILFFVFSTLFAMLPSTLRADRVDSLRQVIASSTGDALQRAFVDLRNVYRSQGMADEEIALLEEQIAYERQHGDLLREGNMRYDKIAVLSNMGRDEALMAEADVQRAWFEEHEQWEHFYDTWESKASTYLYSNKVQTALHEAELMLRDAQTRNNNYGRVTAYLLLGISYETISQLDDAIDNLRRAYELVKTEKTKSVFFTVCDYLCQTYDTNGMFSEELSLSTTWSQAIDEYRERSGQGATSFKGIELSCHVQRAHALMGLNRFSEAEDELTKAQACLEFINSPLTQFRVLFCRARLCQFQGQFSQALAVLDSIQAMNLEMGGSVEFVRANVLLELGRYEEAARLFLSEYNKQDSIFTHDMQSRIGELTMLYKIDEQQMKSRLQRNKLLAVIAFILLAAMVAYGLLRHRASRRIKQKAQELEQKNLELEKANQRAADSARMKMDFIKSISHEIRTPLNILSGFTQIITSPKADLSGEQLTDIHHRINENTDRIVQLVNKMLELSESNSQTVIERCDELKAREIVEAAIHTSRIHSTPSVTFEWDADNPYADTILVTNRQHVVRAFSCLLENASKFTMKGLIAVRLWKRGDKMQFIVEDTGIGVPPDQGDRIFDEFVQLDDYTEGAGIGLTVARSIARRLGGDIILDTAYTAGARFIMSLPQGQ